MAVACLDGTSDEAGFLDLRLGGCMTIFLRRMLIAGGRFNGDD
jgi:hypothetical protein